MLISIFLILLSLKSNVRTKWPDFVFGYSIFMQTEVSTVICGKKELKKLVDIRGQLETVKRVIYMDADISPNEALGIETNVNWMVVSFSEVEKIGKENLIGPDLPLSADIAVIMYTSGSTGMPKVS